MRINEAPAPFLLNSWKHHAGYIVARLFGSGPRASVEQLARELRIVGANNLDLYTGRLGPEAIARELAAALRELGILEREIYSTRLSESGGYLKLRLSDESVWVLRAGETSERYIHLHPAKGTPLSRRFQANILKSAIMVLALEDQTNREPTEPTEPTEPAWQDLDLDPGRINQARVDHLGLSPLRAGADGGIQRALACLREVARESLAE